MLFSQNLFVRRDDASDVVFARKYMSRRTIVLYMSFSNKRRRHSFLLMIRRMFLVANFLRDVSQPALTAKRPVSLLKVSVRKPSPFLQKLDERIVVTNVASIVSLL